MPSQLKNFIKLGMRNPFFIEVNLHCGDIFAKWVDPEDHSRGDDLSKSVTVKDFESGSLGEQLDKITELPSGLTNFYRKVPHQASKLPDMLTFLAGLKGQRIIIFFATCASVDFHFLVLQKLLPKENFLAKLHGKINQKKRTKIYNGFKSRKIE